MCEPIARGNRQSQAQFSCKKCGYTTHADFNAAKNIRHRAHVNVPQVAGRRPQQLWRLAGVGANDKLSLDRVAVSGSR